MDKIEACLPSVPSLRRKLAHLPFELDRPYWVDDPDFDLEFHVRQLALPRPGDWRQFRTQVARLHSRPVDISRPPWEMTVIEGLEPVRDLPPGCFATVIKVHHAAIDGQSGVELLNVIHDLDPTTPFDAIARRLGASSHAVDGRTAPAGGGQRVRQPGAGRSRRRRQRLAARA